MSAVHASRGPLKPASAHAAVRGRHRLQHRRGHAGRPTARCRGRSTAPTTPTSARRSRTSCRAARRTTRRSSQPGGFVLPHPPRDSRTFPTETGKAHLHVPARWTCSTCPRGGCCCRACAATTSSTPRSTGSATATAGSQSGRRVVFVHRGRHRGARLRRRRRRRPGQRVGGRHRALGAVVPDRRLRHPARLRGGVLPGGEPAGARSTRPPTGSNSPTYKS